MSYNNMIMAEDPQAVMKLKENISSLENRQEYMQKVNDFYKEHGTVQGCSDISYETALELDKRVNENQSTPYPGKFFKDNYAEINRMKSNIERLETRKETLFKSWQFRGGKAVVNLANNRLQLMFKEKPDEEMRNALKQNGFKWAPTQKAWQRPLDYKTMAAADRIDFIKPISGIKPSELQPKQQKRNVPER